MATGVYNIKWKHFNVNQDYSLNCLFKKHKNSDVTLVTDDKVAFPAHKFVLSACSSVLKDLLLKNPHPHPIIYLNGVQNVELDSLLQFMYLGKTQFHQSSIEKFIENGKNLQIKQLSPPLIKNGEPIAKETVFSDEFYGGECKIMKEDGELAGGRDSSVLNEDTKSYSCEKCEAVFNSIQELVLHRKHKHESTGYKCEICPYKTTNVGNFKQHKDHIHKGVRYSCDSCNYKATQISKLRIHRQAKHKDIN